MSATERIEELRTYAPENLTERDLDFLLKVYDEMKLLLAQVAPGIELKFDELLNERMK